MIEDKNRLFDGSDSFSGGMDGGKRGNLIGMDQYQDGENVTCRGGNVRTRPAFKKLEIAHLNEIYYRPNGTLNDESVGTGTYETFTQGLFQGAHYFDPTLGDDCIVASVSGRLFKIVPRRTLVEVRELELAKQNRGNVPVAYMVQADRFLVVQDGESTAIIYDGVSARRAGKDEMPVGTIMAYGMGRIVLVGTNRRDILFGDLYGSHEGEPGESVLKFTETTFLSEGGAASIPFSMGHIRGAFFYPQQDTSMGQGELIVAAEKGMASFFLSLPREQWKTSAFQRMALLDIGGRGHRAFTPLNGDVWFRAGDGWRLYRQARAETRGYAQIPLSTEVGKYVDAETEALLYLSSSIRFDNRLIATVNPIPNQGRPYHNGLIALDFDPLSSFGTAKKPAWDGHWKGVKVLQLVEGDFNGEHRAFMFGLDRDGFNAVYELTKDGIEDSSGPITSSVVPRTFNFQQPYNENGLYDCDIWFDSVRRETTLTASYRPDGYPNWLPWSSSCPVPSVDKIEGANSIGGIPAFSEGFKPRLSLGKPDAGCDTLSTNRDLKRSYELNLKLEWTGNAAINRLRVHDKPKPEKYTSA